MLARPSDEPWKLLLRTAGCRWYRCESLRSLALIADAVPTFPPTFLDPLDVLTLFRAVPAAGVGVDQLRGTVQVVQVMITATMLARDLFFLSHRLQMDISNGWSHQECPNCVQEGCLNKNFHVKWELGPFLPPFFMDRSSLPMSKHFIGKLLRLTMDRVQWQDMRLRTW